jgi:hypothetical protein
MAYLSDNMETADIYYMLDNPWKVSENEWGLRDSITYHEIACYIIDHLDLTQNDGFSRLWRTRSGEPIALLGFYKISTKLYESFFFASKHMDENGMKITRELYRTIKEKTANYHGCRCTLYSSSKHPKQIAWLEFLGYSYVPEGNIDNARYFEFAVPE